MLEASKAMARRSKTLTEYQRYFLGNGIDIGESNVNEHIKDNEIFGKNIQSCRDYSIRGGSAEYCRDVLDNSYDFLHSSHGLEHLSSPERGILNWIRIVKIDGYLTITVPDEEMYEKNQWPSPFNIQHLWSFRVGGENERDTSIEVNSFFSKFKDVKIISIKRITDNYFETDDDLTVRTDIPIECSIEIVLQKISHTYKSVSRWTQNSFCFMLNSLAMGDVIAALPVIKYMIKNYYTDPGTYKVVAKEMFRPLFSFVPNANFINYENAENDWGIPKNWAVGTLNQKNNGTNIIRNTPKSMHLSQFASFKLVDMLLTEEQLHYVKVPEVVISHFGHDFSKSVIFVASYRDVTRMWKASYMLELAAWVKFKGYTPVFVGKTDMNLDTHLVPKTSLPDNIGSLGLDLRNKTSILELATIMSKSKAVVGLDSGPIHLAGCTNVPIVCGYTTVDPCYRIPIRAQGITYAVTPDIECKHCESNWACHFHNYENCYLGPDPKCCEEMTAGKFIQKLQLIL